MADKDKTHQWMDCIPGVSLKSDLNTIDAPIFSLKTNTDTEQFVWEKDGYKITVTPNKYGRATIWDKDIVLYVMGQVAASLNRNLEPSRLIRTTQRDILLAIKRGTDGRSYRRLKAALRRRNNTSIETNIVSGEYSEIKEFSLIHEWRIIRSDGKSKNSYVEIIISEWLYQSVLAMDIITYDQEYFKIRKSLERRLYEIFRKHLGKSSAWNIHEAKLFQKVGGSGTIYRFRNDLNSFEGSITGFRFYQDPLSRNIFVYPGSKQ